MESGFFEQTETVKNNPPGGSHRKSGRVPFDDAGFVTCWKYAALFHEPRFAFSEESSHLLGRCLTVGFSFCSDGLW